MYYRLKEPWMFCGWKRLPYAIGAVAGEHKHKRPFFLQKELFLDLLRCDGSEDINVQELSEETRRTLEEMIAGGMMETSDEVMKSLQPWQRYHVYPSRYLQSVHWSITGKCNFRCRHCLVSAPNANHPQLPLSDCMHIIDEIARCGIPRVDITGGEPLVRTDFEEIVKALSQRNIDIGVLFTNASLLTRDTLEMLKKYHQYPTVQMSFDGLGHHDWLRGIEGAEKQADAALRLLKEYDVPVAAAMCIHKGNRDSLRDTVNYLAGSNVASLRLNAPQELGIWKQYAREYALSEDEVWDIYRSYIPYYFQDGMPIGIELDGYFQCGKGSTAYRIPYVHHGDETDNWDRIPYCESMRYGAYIGPEGKLAPCMGFSDTVLKENYPSVLEQHLGDLTLKGYYYDLVETKVGDLLRKNPECARCEFMPKCCGGCMLESMSDDGDFLIPDERCCYFHKHIGEKAVREAADAAILAAGLAKEESSKPREDGACR